MARREAMQEIRSVKNLVCNYQPAAFHGTSSGVIGSLSGGTTVLLSQLSVWVDCDSIVDSKAGLNSLNAIPSSISSHDPYLVQQPAPHEVSYGVTGLVPEGTEGLLLNGTRGFANNVTHQGFPASYYMDVTESSSEGADLLDVDDTSDPVCEPAGQPTAQQLGSVAQISQAKVKVKCPKVKCPWDKCPKFINKNDLTRHINEVHEKKIVAVCPRCKREFTRTNVMTHHACPL
ncbi:hypothetical protein EV424DRAFT_1627772 [Suillus variegatus]|nr:hypothetical protein EV424DRAFT_1627772 [Suillus variegatus]